MTEQSPQITDEDRAAVAAAVDALEAQGTAPSINRVIEAMRASGGALRRQTVAAALRELRAPGPDEDSGTTPAPPQALVRAVWAEAWKAASREAEVLSQDALQAMREAVAERDEALDAADEAEARATLAEERAEQAAEKMREAEERAKQAGEQAQKLEAWARQIEQQAAQQVQEATGARQAAETRAEALLEALRAVRAEEQPQEPVEGQ